MINELNLTINDINNICCNGLNQNIKDKFQPLLKELKRLELIKELENEIIKELEKNQGVVKVYRISESDVTTAQKNDNKNK